MCLEKKRVRSKVIPRKRVVEVKRRGVPERESEDHSAMMFSAACTTEVATPTELDEDQTARSSAKREK